MKKLPYCQSYIEEGKSCKTYCQHCQNYFGKLIEAIEDEKNGGEGKSKDGKIKVKRVGYD